MRLGNLRCFGLDSTDVNLLRRSNLIVVKLAVLKGCAHHPNRTLTFDQDSATAIDVDLVMI
jgi:hypothetical protein